MHDTYARLADPRVEAVLADFDARAAREHEFFQQAGEAAVRSRIDEFLISIGRATGVLLNTLAKAAGSRLIVELGTSYGHSAVFLADAARATGGRLISMDVSAAKQAHARASLDQAGLGAFVTFRTVDALEGIGDIAEPIDFVLIDLWKDLYVPCFDLLLPKLAEGAFIAADNMLFPPSAAEDARAYRKRVRETPGVQTVLLPVGSGVELSRYAPDGM